MPLSVQLARTKALVIGTDGYYNSDGDWIDSDGTVYPKVSFGTGNTMEEAEEDAERNASR